MKAIIPAKASSERVPGKNWRPFHQGKSLVDINVEALLACGFSPADIYVSCESPEPLAAVAARYAITTLPRSPDLCGNDVPITDWMRGICGQVPGDDDIVWSQVCDPLFDAHRAVLERWEEVRDCHDSISVVHPGPAYLLDEHFRPIGWGFGEWHVPSQRLQQCYTFPFTMSILKRTAIARTGYHLGTRPAFYIASGAAVDIDTPDDFELAQLRYGRSRELHQRCEMCLPTDGTPLHVHPHATVSPSGDIPRGMNEVSLAVRQNFTSSAKPICHP